MSVIPADLCWTPRQPSSIIRHSGMGEAYRARDTTLNWQASLKE